MIWIVRIIFAILFLTAMDLVNGLLGLLLSSFPFRKYPKLHRAGLLFLAMSFFSYGHVLPRRCEMCCGVDPCRCWNCPGQKSYAKIPVKILTYKK